MNFKAYKNQLMGVSGMFDTAEVRLHDMVFVDNTEGVNFNTGGDKDEILLSFYDSYVFGEHEKDSFVADDCPSADECYCKEKRGFSFFASNTKTKDVHITGASALPMHKTKSYGAWGPEVEVENVVFADFRA
jgi:hypothetical protein